MYYIGIDGGGTNSRITGINREAEIIGSAIGGPTNITAMSNVAENIKKLLHDFNTSNRLDIIDCAAVYMGSAGASVAKNAATLEGIFREAGYTCKIKIVSDAELVLAAETKGEAGIILISGTGSSCFAVTRDSIVRRVGGWGHIIDDGGSGYRMGMDAVKAALFDWDGRGTKTELLPMIINDFNLHNIEEILSFVYSDKFDKSRIANIAHLIQSAGDRGDKVALSIEATAVRDLFIAVKAMVESTGLDKHKLVLSGSIVTKYERIKTALVSKLTNLYPNLKISEASVPSELGAAYLAMKDATLHH